MGEDLVDFGLVALGIEQIVYLTLHVQRLVPLLQYLLPLIQILITLFRYIRNIVILQQLLQRSYRLLGVIIIRHYHPLQLIRLELIYKA